MTPEVVLPKTTFDASMAVIGLLIMVLGWLIKRWFNKVDDSFKEITIKLDASTQKHIDCRDSLPERFAPKIQTERDLKELFQWKDNHNGRIKVLEKVMGVNDEGPGNYPS